MSRSSYASWTVLVPVVAALVLAMAWGRELSGVAVAVVTLFLGGGVLAAVHHAEVVAHRVGEPFGSLVLAVAVTIIEVALIVALMAVGGGETRSLARDTVFAAVMITCNGIVGLSILFGTLCRPCRLLQPRGRGRGTRDGGDAGGAQPGLAHFHDHRARAGVLAGPARLRGGHSPRIVCAVRGTTDGSAPRLLPAGHGGSPPTAETDRHAERPSTRADFAQPRHCWWWRWGPSSETRSRRLPRSKGESSPQGFPLSVVG